MEEEEEENRKGGGEMLIFVPGSGLISSPSSL